MSDLQAVLGYLADIASGDRPTSFFVKDVAFTGITPFIPADRAIREPLERLAAIDQLHREENLVWRGELWIVGEIDGVHYRWPINRQPVSLRNVRRAKVFSSLELGEPKPLGSWTLPRGLIDQPELTEVALADSEAWSAIGLGWSDHDPTDPKRNKDRDQGVAHGRSRIERFVSRYLAAAGLPELPIVSEQPAAGSEPVVLLSNGYYVDRDPFELNRSSVLKLWRGMDLDASVLSTLYGSEAVEPLTQTGAAGDEQAIQSPLPLNGRQQRAVALSRTNLLTVVSGPPGTGKSHLVAAAAINQVAEGRSVLVATQSLHASDVVAELIERYPMVEALRFGDAGSVRRLSDKLATGIAANDDRFDLSMLQRRCGDLTEKIERHRERLTRRVGDLASFESAMIRRHDVPLWLAQRDLDSIDVPAVRAAAIDRDASGLVHWWKRRQARNVLGRAFGSRPAMTDDDIDELAEVIEAEQLVNAIAGRDLGLDELWIELDRLEEQWRATIGDLLEAKRRARAKSKTRESLSEFASALRLGVAARRQALASVGDEFLQVVPLWIGTLGEIEAVLPVEPALFDLVILDEASQISQVSAVPALARAKRAMIVGDSRQLRHVSFVSTDLQNNAAEVHGLSPPLRSRLNDRTNSAFDVATAAAPVVELDEHFRSVPHIIGFSDRQFYGGKLRLMTQHPRNEARDAIEVVTVTGSRGDNRVVQAEVDEVLVQVRKLMAEGKSSIGVVSPFRAQADALEAALLASFTIEEIDRHHLRVGTVHSFQGTERDQMIISVGVGPDDRNVMRFLEDPAVFNVMVTRARSHVIVITSLTRSEAGDGLLGQYLRHADEPPSPRREQIHGSGWAERVASDLASQTTERIITDYEVAGETIDVVVGSGADAFGIETEMHPGGPQPHIERRLALRRAGWDIVSLHRASCYGREEEAVAGLLARIARLQR